MNLTKGANINILLENVSLPEGHRTFKQCSGHSDLIFIKFRINDKRPCLK